MSDQLTPGPELDARMAELMGWRLSEGGLLWLSSPYDEMCDDRMVKDWHPSTSSAQAVDEIIPAMEAKGYECEFRTRNRMRYVNFTRKGRHSEVYSVGLGGHATLAGAVCMAVVAMKEEKQ